MLNPKLITDAIVATLKLIPDLSAAMTVNGAIRIDSFHYRLGSEHRLAAAVYGMGVPSMLVAWEGTQPGNFNGYSIFKHRFGVYFRMGNMAGQDSPIGYEDLWTMAVNSLPSGSPVNIRYMSVYPGLDIMDTPGVNHELDEDLVDRFKGVFIFPEIGDQ